MATRFNKTIFGSGRKLIGVLTTNTGIRCNLIRNITLPGQISRAWNRKYQVQKECSLLRLHSSTDCGDSDINDDEQIRYFNLKHELQVMTFGQLKELASQQYKEKGRDLIRIKLQGDKLPLSKQTPTFRILLPSELEEIVRKNRQHKKQQLFEKIAPSHFLDTSSTDLDSLELGASDTTVKSGRIRQKQIRMKVGIGDHDFQAAIKRISKWLSSGTTFVAVTITSNGKKVEGKALEASIKNNLEAVDGIKNLTVKVT